MGAILAAPIRSQLLQREGNANFRVGCSQMQGFRPEMEDAHSICMPLDGHPSVSLFAVYDGHAGEMVAKHLAQELPGKLAKLEKFDDESLRRAILEFDLDIGKQEFKNHGSTCVFALVQPDDAAASDSWRVTAVNVGDSRVMLVRANGTLVSMTADHKPDDKLEKARILKAGGSVSNNRVDGGLAMSRAIGDYGYKMDAGLSQLETKVIALPDITHEFASPGDRLLVICDGIVERITNKDVAQFVHEVHNKHRDDPAEVMRQLILFSLASGSTDNHSGILVSFEDGSDYAKPNEFIAGPLSEWSGDRQFVNAYLKNAKAWGQTAETLPALIKQAEANMPKDWRKVSQPEENFLKSHTGMLLMAVLFVAAICFAMFRWEAQQEEDFSFS